MTRRCWMTEAEIKAVVDKACGHYRWPCTTPTQMIRPRSSVTGPEADYPGRRPVQWAALSTELEPPLEPERECGRRQRVGRPHDDTPAGPTPAESAPAA
jgi:hypothetical protein